MNYCAVIVMDLVKVALRVIAQHVKGAAFYIIKSAIIVAMKSMEYFLKVKWRNALESAIEVLMQRLMTQKGGYNV
jgi:hypothetical protein